ncbi:M23 family metallopeptidase [Reichenbachiella agariperforans]|uniref:Peptidase family M23 n=1 Tax=Reichenbachiella agariperforans TaxID=156994 RepID=A0A1M6L5T7_REIAG|nr:M23 family metallopeptidase [Reichenbachiella agariperforans]MBU2913800.1 M23 family metallopeptidase [Reichenbachiella agariperforans]SHJ66571.1 Peptidase family M23 [Reichenbachiella agariperforans]
MARIKYYYDTESCKYERVKVSTWDIILNALGFLSLSVMLSVGMFIVYNKYFKSPVVAQLEKENEELVYYYERLQDEMADASQMLTSLQERDDNVYRVIFEAEPIPSSIRNAGVGGTDRYKEVSEKGLEREDLLLEAYTKIDKLKKQMYIQTKSYDELIEMASNKEAFFASLPAIQPVSNKELKRFSSGFGYRTDPILKTRKMHWGVDFSAPKGTPIYTTGDGVVSRVHSSFGGYGKQIEIDHGYGYVTKYAHMSKFNVEKGQKVKRGECIGYVGDSGKSTAPHLHYEVSKDGKKINPVHFFYKDLNAAEYEEILRLAAIENQALGSY